ncbi:MAG: polysaccharide biosynthesis C-terminal domain-containing protein [Flavobacteriales bacterium]|nr:polysaccharide biosynthesis C-terminal domain-containing protein [Flavobacteriales bacterium]
MGIIRKQSIQTSLLSYLGVGLGYINVVLLFPKFFAPEEFGLTRVLIAVIGISAQVALFGLTNAIIKFFPKFREGDEENHHGFLGLNLLWGIAGVFVVGAVLFFAQSWIVEYKKGTSDLFVDYYVLLFPFLLFEVLNQLLSSYTRALYHSVINVFFREVFLRFTTTTLILLFYFDWLDIGQFMWLFVLQQGLIALGMLIYLKAIGHFNLKIDRPFLTRELRAEIFHYRTFTMLTNVSAIMLVSVDVVMISYMMGLDNTAFYTVAYYIMALINIPRNAINNVSLSVVSDAWKREDRAAIQTVYAKTSINQLLIGILIFAGIWANEANIFRMLPAEYADGKWVLFFVGVGKLMDVGFGINSGIISTSSVFRFDTYANVILLVVTVVLNLIFIPAYGIAGAAAATSISLASFNISKYIFLKMKFGFDPFSWKSMVTILLGLIAYAASLLLPEQSNFIVDIILRSSIILLVYLPISLAFKLSEDVNAFLLVIWQQIRSVDSK